MALPKQTITINFAKGIDTKTDPYQITVGTFAALKNSIFDTLGRLTKRNGYSNLTALPNAEQSILTTLNGNLIAAGIDLYAYSRDTNEWLNEGRVQPVKLNTLPLIRVSTSQTGADAVVSANSLTLLVYMDNGASYYQISDSDTGQQIVNRVALPATAKNPRAFILGPYFIITFIQTVSGSPNLRYIAIPTANPQVAGTPGTISNSVGSLNSGYDGFVGSNNILYMAWGGPTNTVKVAGLLVSLIVTATQTIPASNADIMSVTVDSTVNRVFISFWDAGSTNAYSAAYDYTLTQTMAKTLLVSGVSLRTVTSIATGNSLKVFYETINTYPSGALSDYVSTVTVTPPVSFGTGTVSAPTVVLRSVGLASKAILASTGEIYMMVAYGPQGQTPSTNDSNQPTYFLIDSTGAIYMRLAYSNGGGYMSSQVLPTISVLTDEVTGRDAFYVPYLITDFLTTVNKGTALPSGTPVNAIYTQTGVNLARFIVGGVSEYLSEIAGALHLTGGQLWEYDGVTPVEHGFQVWPENVAVSTSTTGGLITAQTYNYVFTYEWTDAAGNLHRSAPSIPTTIVTTGSTSTNTLVVPTLRLTYKVQPNPVRIVGYRWSTAQQTYYQFTDVQAPVVNDPSVDYVTIVDTLADSAILGTTLLYTTGGVVENIAAPASAALALFNNRLFLIDAENPNLLWFSKQVIQNTPVEMSDLLTLYIAPTSGAQGSTGPTTALSAMDDKLIIFKRDAIYYITGRGPDNTGANNDFSDPVFVTSTVGCSNPNSIVLMPDGLMFQSDKGIWLLGRDLSTLYIGFPVETYNNAIVYSATAIPGTNQVRFVIENNVTLVYDYFVKQWLTHSNINAIAATLYEGQHTYLNSYGQVFQETPGMYTDGSKPVLMSLTTSWLNLAGLQGYERFYFAHLLGTYYTPFTLDVQIAYDYNPSAVQSISVLPDNYASNWGDEALWGSGGPWGGPGNVFKVRLFPENQKCETFQITINEVYDPSFNVPPGAGLTLSGLDLTVGAKKQYRTQSSRNSFG